MVSVDFFTVPTITLRIMFVFVLLEHRRREVLHFNVTEHPTAAWVADKLCLVSLAEALSRVVSDADCRVML